MIRNAVKLSLCIIFLSIFIIQTLSSGFDLAENESPVLKPVQVSALRGDIPVEINAFTKRIKANSKVQKSEGSIQSDSGDSNPFSPIHSKVAGTGTFIEDYIDNHNSDVDSLADSGNLTDFDNMKDTDSVFANLSETTDLISGSFGHGVGVGNEAATADNGLYYVYEGDGTPTTFYIDGVVDSIFIDIAQNFGGVLDFYLGTISGSTFSFHQYNPIASVDVSGKGTGWMEFTAPADFTAFNVNQGDVLAFYSAMEDAYIGRSTSGSYLQYGYTTVNDPFSTPQPITMGSVARRIEISVPVTGSSSDYHLDQEVQFENVYNSSLIDEELRIKTGVFSTGSENLNVSYWDGNSWQLITSSLTASSWNNFTLSDISVTEPYFTIKFGGAQTTADSIQDWWMIDAVLVYVEQHIATTIEDYIDIQSDMDSSPDLGSHDTFADLLTTDSVYNNISESEPAPYINSTLIDTESFEGSWPPFGWTESGFTNWNKENNAAYDGVYSADFDGADPGQSGYLYTPVLDASDAVAIYLEFWWRDTALDFNEFILELYNGTNWISYQDMNSLPHAENTWIFYSEQITDSQYFVSTFQIRWRANDVESFETAYLDFVTVTKKINNPLSGYQLDLEVQFTGVYDSPIMIEELSIKTGTFGGTEDLNVTYWDGSSWQLITSSLTASTWNNFTISLTSPTFTIKFGGSTTSSDNTQNWWEIDSVLLKVESPEDTLGKDSGFIWLDAPDEIDLGTSYSSWVQQDISDDSVPSSATGVILAWVSDSLVDNHAVARGSQDTNDYMNGGSIYSEFEDETWRMQVVKLSGHRYIDTWRESATERLYVMGYTVGSDPRFRRVAADLGGLTADSSWNSVTVTDVDENTTGVIILGQSTSSIDSTILVRAVGSTDSMIAREWQEFNMGVFFVEIDGNDQFDYYITEGTSANFYLIAEAKDSIDWLSTNRIDISATATGWTVRDLDSYTASIPLDTSGVILQHESIGTGGSDYRNIARAYGQTWTLPDYDVGGDTWMMAGSGIDSQNRIQIYAEFLEQDVYIHALTRFSDRSSPVVENFGVDDPGTGTATFWADLTDQSGVNTVTITVNGTDYQMSYNGSFWIKDLTVKWQKVYSYQITNASDIFGNFLTAPSGTQDYSFDYDSTVPIVIDWEYYQGADGTWDDQNNTFIANVSDSWGEIDTVIFEVTTHSLTAAMVQYFNFSGILAFRNNSLDLPNGGINFRIIVNDTSGNGVTSSTHSGSVFYNHPPFAYDLTLTSAPYYSNSTLNLAYTYWDEDSHPQSGTEIRWYKNGLLQGEHNNSLVIGAVYLFDGDEWNATVRPKDGTLFGQLNYSSTITVSNTPPTFSNLNILPINPVTTSTLLVDYDYFDYDGNNENFTLRQIEWYKVGTGHLVAFDDQASISSINTVKGEEYYARVRVSDGRAYSVWMISSTIIIGNSHPSAVNLSLPINPTNVTDLTATWDMQDDDTSDVENKSAAIIYWYKNGVLQSSWTNSTAIGSGNTSKGQIWWFEIRIFDGEEYSAITELTPHIEILNSIPTVGNVIITTSSPVTTDDLAIGTWSYSDEDNDTEDTPIIHWYLDGNLQSTYDGYTSLPSIATAKGDNWHFGIRTYDGSAYSFQVNSSPVLILNTAPEVGSPAITLAPTTTEDLIASWTYNDNDTDGLTFDVAWYLNGVFNSSWSVTANNAILNAGNTSKNQMWYFTVQAYDGEEFSILLSLEFNVTILNSLPTVSNPTFNNTSPATNDDFNITYTYLDDDGDAEITSELIVYWYVDWVYQSQYENFTAISNQDTQTDEVWYYVLRVFDGFSYSNNYTSLTGIIIGGGINSKPIAENLTLTPSMPVTSDDLTASYDYFDPESNEQIAFEIIWYLDNAAQPQYQTLTVPASATTKGDQWNFTIRVFDGLQWSDLNSSAVYVIGNTAPQVSGLSAAPNPTTTDDLVVSWISVDEDLDSLTFNVTWILNGVINSSWWTPDHFATLMAGNTTKGDNWNVTVEAYDGDNGYSPIITLASNITILNTIPEAENLTLTLGPRTGDDLTATWDYSDIDGDTQNTSATIIYWYKNGDLQSLLTNLTTVGYGNTSKGQVWWFKVKVYDDEDYSVLYELLPHIEIQNTAPVNVSALPVPTNPTKENGITLSLSSILSSFYDADGGDNIEVVEIRWYKGGIPQVNLNDSLTVAGSKLTKGENWSYTVIVSDGFESGTFVTSPEFEIVNSVPTILTAYIAETNVRTIHNLTAGYLYDDADGESVSVSEIRWYRSTDFINYFLMATYDGNLSLPNTATTKNERWKFNITITDGFNESVWKLSDYIEIENSVPWIDPYSIALIGGRTTSDSILVTYAWYDDDGDTQSGTTFAWENSTHILLLDNTLESIYTRAGESWSVSITPGDGTSLGQVVNSKFYGVNIIIGNTPPEIPNNEIKIQGNDPNNGSYTDGIAFGTNSDLVVRYNVTDIDGTQGVVLYDVFMVGGYALGSDYRWFRNRSGIVTLIVALTGMTTVPAAHTVRGDLWWVEVKPQDLQGDFGTAVNSTKIGIANTAPYLTSVSWEQSSFYTSDDLLFTYNFGDHDQSDIEQGSIIEWYRDGVNQTGFFNFVSIPSQNTTKTEEWFARIKVYDGNLFSAWYYLPNITIANTAPVISNIILIPLSATADQDLVVSWNYTDADNDSQQVPRIRWYKNDVLQSNLNNLDTIDSGNLSKNDFWYVIIEVYDGNAYSAQLASSSINILNSPPILTNVVLWNNNDRSNTTFSDGSISIYYFNYTDVDNDLIDPAGIYIQWYRDGIYQSLYDNQTTLSSVILQKGYTWSAIIQIVDIDGTIWSNNLTSQSISVINKAPDILEFSYVGNEYSGFVVEDEGINISLATIDVDIGDDDFSFIHWYINGVYQSQYDNIMQIEPNHTSPGEIWTAIVTPSDGIDNGTSRNLVILIESRPKIEDFDIEIEQDIDGHFTFSLRVNDSRNEVLTVVYQITLNGTELDVTDILTSANGTGHWIFDYYLSDIIYYDTDAVIKVTAESSVGVRSIKSFNYTLVDGVAPRVSNQGLGVRFVKNGNNPSQLSFYADIEEYGSGVANITLHYYYNATNQANNGGQGSSLSQEYPAIMMGYNGTENNVLIYAVTVPFPQDGLNYEVLYWVSTQDLNGNFNPVAFDINEFPDRIKNEEIVRPLGGLPEWVLLVAAMAIVLIFMGSVTYIRFFRKPELIGLDKELVLKNVVKQSDTVISESLDHHSLGIVVSFFSQHHGPIPIIVLPEILRDNFGKLIEISDRAFGNCGFTNNFEKETMASFDFDLTQEKQIRSLSFGYSLNRPKARGGQENITLSILLNEDIYAILNHFQDEILVKVHLVHKMMDERPEAKEEIRKSLNSIRRYVSSIILAHQEIYGDQPAVMEMLDILGFGE